MDQHNKMTHHTQYTFGSTPAAVSLEQLIDEIPDEIERNKIRSKISSYLSDYSQILKVIADIPEKDLKQKTFLYNLVIEDLKNNFRKNVPEKIRTHAQNVIVARARDTVLRS